MSHLVPVPAAGLSCRRSVIWYEGDRLAIVDERESGERYMRITDIRRIVGRVWSGDEDSFSLPAGVRQSL